MERTFRSQWRPLSVPNCRPLWSACLCVRARSETLWSQEIGCSFQQLLWQSLACQGLKSLTKANPWVTTANQQWPMGTWSGPTQTGACRPVKQQGKTPILGFKRMMWKSPHYQLQFLSWERDMSNICKQCVKMDGRFTGATPSTSCNSRMPPCQLVEPPAWTSPCLRLMVLKRVQIQATNIHQLLNLFIHLENSWKHLNVLVSFVWVLQELLALESHSKELSSPTSQSVAHPGTLFLDLTALEPRCWTSLMEICIQSIINPSNISQLK